MKTFVLVYPPPTTCEIPPLGMAVLKGHLGRVLPGWRVKTIDLSLRCLQIVRDALAEGWFRFRREFYEETGAGDGEILAALAMMNGGDDERFFLKPEAYLAASNLFLAYVEEVSRILLEDCRNWKSGQDCPPLVARLLGEVLAEGPDAVGLSASFSEQLPVTAVFGTVLRESFGVPVYIGGGCFVRGADAFLDCHPGAADAVIIGDGEEPLRQLLENGGRVEEVAGAVYRRDGAVVENPPVFHPRIADFGVPDFSDYDLRGYFSPEPVLPILLSRGCSWRKCTFCTHYYNAGDTYRLQSMPLVIDHIRDMAERGVSRYMFVDDIIPPGLFVQFADAIGEAGLKIAYTALSKPSRSFSPERLRRIAQSGCAYIIWGVESGSQRILDMMGKGTTVQDNIRLLKDAAEAGMFNHVFILLGFPTETAAELAETVRFLEGCKEHVHAVHATPFSVDPGSPIARDPGRFGIEELRVVAQSELGPHLAYRTASGLSMAQVKTLAHLLQPYLMAFSPFASTLANMRGHALLVYERVGHRLSRSRSHIPDADAMLDYAFRALGAAGGGTDGGASAECAPCQAERVAVAVNLS